MSLLSIYGYLPTGTILTLMSECSAIAPNAIIAKPADARIIECVCVCKCIDREKMMEGGFTFEREHLWLIMATAFRENFDTSRLCQTCMDLVIQHMLIHMRNNLESIIFKWLIKRLLENKLGIRYYLLHLHFERLANAEKITRSHLFTKIGICADHACFSLCCT